MNQVARLKEYQKFQYSDHTIFYMINQFDVYMHLSAAIFIDYRAICSADNYVCDIRALAAHSANCPPEPIPITSSISNTFPVPSNSTIRFLSTTINVASKCFSILPVLHYFAQFIQDLSVWLGYLFITPSRPSIKVKASAKEPAKPQNILFPSGLIFLPLVLTLMLPQDTWPSPIITVQLFLLRARIVV